MPFQKNGKRNYQAELAWEKEHGKERQNARVKRNQARAEMEKKVGHKLPTSTHVDHKQALSRGGDNKIGNLQLMSAARNTSFSRTKSGAMASETSKRERKKK